MISSSISSNIESQLNKFNRYVNGLKRCKGREVIVHKSSENSINLRGFSNVSLKKLPLEKAIEKLKLIFENLPKEIQEKNKSAKELLLNNDFIKNNPHYSKVISSIFKTPNQVGTKELFVKLGIKDKTEIELKGLDLTVGFYDNDNQSLEIGVVSKKLSEGKFFKLVILQRKAVLLNESKEKVFEVELEKLELENLERTLIQLSGFVKDSELPLKKLIPKNSNVKEIMANSCVIRMCNSIEIPASSIVNKARGLGLRLDSKVKDYKHENYKTIIELLIYYGAAHRVHLFAEMSIKEITDKIYALKETGLNSNEGTSAILNMLDNFKIQENFNSRDSELLELLRTRFENLSEYDEQDQNLFICALKYRYSNSDSSMQKYLELRKNFADNLIEDADKFQNEKAGAFFQGGWRKKGMGHLIGIELRQVAGKYRFILANVGEGSKFHRPNFSNQEGVFSIPIITFVMNTKEEAREAIEHICDFNAALREEDDIAEAFYKIFDNALRLEDYSIPSRIQQTSNSCGIRSQLELFYYVCQREGNSKFANEFQKYMQDTFYENAKDVESTYSGLKDFLLQKGERPAIDALNEGIGQLVLSSADKSRELIIPYGKGIETTFGSKGDVAFSKSESIFDLHAMLTEKKGRVVISLHPDAEGAAIIIKRGEKSIVIEKQKVKEELFKGDIIFFDHINMFTVL